MSDESFQIERLAGECRASAVIAEQLECEAAMVTASFPAAVALAVGAAIWRDDPYGMRFWPALRPASCGVVLQRRHVVRLEAPVQLLIRLGGGEPIEVGSVEDCHGHELERGLMVAAAGLCVVTGAATGEIPPARFVWACRQVDRPALVVDAASGNWRAWIDTGADLVVLDGAAGLGGPASGIVAGKRELVRCLAQGWLGAAAAMRAQAATVEGLVTAVRARRPLPESEPPDPTLAADPTPDPFRLLQRFPDPPG